MPTSAANKWIPIGGAEPACRGVYVRCSLTKEGAAKYEVIAHHRASKNTTESLAEPNLHTHPLDNTAMPGTSELVEDVHTARERY